MTGYTYQIAAEGAIAVDDANGVPPAALKAALANFSISLPLPGETGGHCCGDGVRAWIAQRQARRQRLFKATVLCLFLLVVPMMYDLSQGRWFGLIAVSCVSLVAIFVSSHLDTTNNSDSIWVDSILGFSDDIDDILDHGWLTLRHDRIIGPDRHRHGQSKELDSQLLVKFVAECRARGLRVPDWSAVLSPLYAGIPPILSEQSVSLFLAGKIRQQAPKRSE